MKQLLILSGKGGTGKTTVASCFIELLQTKAYADCDVEAPNLHITETPVGEGITTDYIGLPKAKINLEKCIGCLNCYNSCRFGAISLDEEKRPYVEQLLCEGCAVCKLVCPSDAVTMNQHVNGQTIVYREEAYFSTAKLKMGAGASGRLVSEVKKNLKDIVPKEWRSDSEKIAIIDGSPGIGCPVIASLSGVDMVLIVTEPSLSGKSDMIRILETAEHFKIKVTVCINKYDICKELTEDLKEYCENKGIPVVGEIPYDKMASIAINEGKSLVQYDTPSATAIRSICKKTIEQL